MSIYSPIQRLSSQQYDLLPSVSNLIFSPLLSLATLCISSIRRSESVSKEIERVVNCDKEDNYDMWEMVKNHTEWISSISLDFNPPPDLIDEQFSSEIYGTKIFSWDFEYNTKKSLKHINTMIQIESKNAIKDPIQNEKYVPLWRKRLAVGSLDVRSKWLRMFNPKLTRMEDFNLLNGSKIQIPMMRDFSWRSLLVYDYGNNVTGVVLPLQTEGFEIVFVRPNGITIDAIKEAENLIFNETSVGNYFPFKEISIPKININQTISLSNSYRQLGLVSLFDRSHTYRNRRLNQYARDANDFIQWNKIHLHEKGISNVELMEELLNLTLSHIEIPVNSTLEEAIKEKKKERMPPFAFIPEEIEKNSLIINGPYLLLVRLYGHIVTIARILNPMDTN